MTLQLTTMKTGNNQTGKKYQIDTSDQDAPIDRDDNTAEESDVATKEHENTATKPRRENTGEGFDHLDMK